jgi:hypothetical protein
VCIFELQKKYDDIVKLTPLPLVVSNEMRNEYNSAVSCPICGVTFSSKQNRKQIHHSHVIPTEKVNGSNCYYGNRTICFSCNIGLKQMTCVFVGHQISKIDSHIILKSLCNKLMTEAKIICRSTESIISLVIGRCRIIDFANFLDYSLPDLIKSHRHGSSTDEWEKKFTRLYTYFRDASLAKLLVNEIGFPYRWLDKFEKLDQTELPSESEFTDFLTGEVLDEGVYSQSLIVYDEFCCQNVREYLKLFTVRSVLLLVDICENFNEFAHNQFELFPFHCSTLHSYNMHAFTNSLGDKSFENIQFRDIYEFANKAISGGIVQSNIKYSCANNEYVSQYDSSKVRKYILNLDIVSSYGCAAMLPLAFRDFRFFSKIQVDHFNFCTDLKKGKGYLLEISILQPIELHEKLNSFPIVFDKRKIKMEELSQQQQIMYQNIFPDRKELDLPEMLILDLHDKDKIVVHWKVLQYWISKGIVLSKIFQILEFTEDPFVSNYMKKILDLRRLSVIEGNKLLSLVLKLLANGLTGRFQQSTEKFSEFKISLTEAESLKLLKHPHLNSFSVLNNDCVLFEIEKQTVFYGNPLLTACCILNLSKLELYKMYDLFQSNFPEVKLIMCDTDSLVLEVTDPNDNLWTFFNDNKHIFDFSNLSRRSKLYSEHNIGKYGGIWKVVQDRIQNVVSIRAKCYSIKSMCTCTKIPDPDCENDHSVKRCSGVNRSALKKLTHDYYLSLLSEPGAIRSIDVQGTRSINNNICFVRGSKAAFHTFSPSRKLLSDGISTAAHGFRKSNIKD